jgi:hypothetical protein
VDCVSKPSFLSCRVSFEADGSTPGRSFTWKTVKPYTIEYNYPDGNHGTIVFERPLNRGAINEIATNWDKENDDPEPVEGFGVASCVG